MGWLQSNTYAGARDGLEIAHRRDSAQVEQVLAKPEVPRPRSLSVGDVCQSVLDSHSEPESGASGGGRLQLSKTLLQCFIVAHRDCSALSGRGRGALGAQRTWAACLRCELHDFARFETLDLSGWARDRPTADVDVEISLAEEPVSSICSAPRFGDDLASRLEGRFSKTAV